MSKLLALDGSSTVCGYSVWDKDRKECLTKHFIKFDEELSLIQKAEVFEIFVTELIDNYGIIEEMVIEESFTKFSGSDDKVIAMLNQMNILYRYVCHKLGMKTNTITVQQARKSALPGCKFVGKDKAGGLNQKEQAFLFLLAKIGEDGFPKKILKSGPRKGQEVFTDEARDISDSYITGLGFLNKK